jgi:ATP-dependent Clp protease adaptor protein ClpS
MTTPDSKQKIKIREDLTPPSLYNIIFLNDDVTTVDFVIMTLVSILDYTEDQAALLAQKIHNEGASVVAVYPYELAEQKALEVTILARNSGFPLMVKIEPSA